MVTFSSAAGVQIGMENGTQQNTSIQSFLIALFKALAALTLFLALIMYSGCASTKAAKQTKEPPLWVTDSAKAFPSTEYIAATGTGASADESLVASTAALSRYFNAEITAQSATTRTLSQNGDGVAKTHAVAETTDILSTATLKALHSTDPYLDTSAGNGNERWITASYIKRTEAWTLLEPELKQHAQSFDTPYDNALLEKDQLLKVLYLASAKKAVPALQESLRSAKCISPSKALWYAEEDDRIADCLSSLTKQSMTAPVAVTVTNDSGDSIYSTLVALLGDNGLTATASGVEDAKYQLTAAVSMDGFSNKSGFFYYPSVTVTLSAGANAVFSYSKTGAKTGATDESVAQSRAYREIKKELETSLFSELTSRMGGNN